MSKLWYLWVMVLVGHVAQAQVTLNLKEARSHLSGTTPLAQTDRWQPARADECLLLPVPAGAMANAEYLAVDVINRSPWLEMFYIEFYEGQPDAKDPKADLQIKVGLMPNMPARVVVPFHYFANKTVFMDRQPRVMKGQVMGRAIDKNKVKYIGLRLTPSEANWQSQIQFLGERVITLSATRPAPIADLDPRLNKNLSAEQAAKLAPYRSEPVVDRFGQNRTVDYPWKVKSDSALKFDVGMHFIGTAISSKYPHGSPFGKYGGLYRGGNFKATGFFRTKYHKKRWWLVDPVGYKFISTGMDCVRPTSAGTVTGFEDFYEWLPGDDDSLAVAYSFRQKVEQIDFVRLNLHRVFGNDWESSWQRYTAKELKDVGFNTIGNWSDSAFIKSARMPYVWPLRGFPDTKVRLFRDFPDVFSAEYRASAGPWAEQLRPWANDPYMIGYFLRNEPEWAFGDHNIALEMLRANPGTESRNQLTVFLQKRYKSIEKLNKAWGTQLKGFDDFKTELFAAPQDLPAVARKDLYGFSELLVDEYLRVPCAAVKQVDKNHLNLGMRYAWISCDLCYRAGAFFDVFSLNGYNTPGPPPTAEITRRTGKPVMIGEFHFGAADRGLPATGICGAATTKDKGLAYQYYVEQGIARPEVVGIHYFQLYDQPLAGRFDGENYGIGFLNVLSLPYFELMRAMMETHERIYEIATGKRKPTEVRFTPAPAIY